MVLLIYVSSSNCLEEFDFPRFYNRRTSDEIRVATLNLKFNNSNLITITKICIADKYRFVISITKYLFTDYSDDTKFIKQ